MNTATEQTETRYEYRIRYYIYDFGVEVIEQMSQERFGIPASQLNERQSDLFYLMLRAKELAERKPEPCITCGRLTDRTECIPCHEGMHHAEYEAYERRLAWKGWG
jgi:hypothetical protein